MINTISRSHKSQFHGGVRKLAPHCIGITLGADKIKAREDAERAVWQAAEDRRLAALREERERELKLAEWQNACNDMRFALPAIGSQITVSNRSAAIQKHDFDGHDRYYVVAIVKGEFPNPPAWGLADTNFVRGLRCFIRDEDAKQMLARTNGYYEYADVTRVQVIAHSKSGKSVIVKMV